MKATDTISNAAHVALQKTQEKMKMFVLKDDKSNTYGLPLVYKTRGLFIRELQDVMSKGETIWARHPQDFTLFEIGEYDEQTGQITTYESKHCIGLVQDLRSSLGQANQ